jgi:hypothetical protein
MSALRHLRKTRRAHQKPLACSQCHGSSDASDLICKSCAADDLEDVCGFFDEDRLSDDMQRALARVYLDMRHGRQRDAIERLERVLDDAAPSWRELA